MADTYQGERKAGQSVVFGVLILYVIWALDLPGYLFFGAWA